MADFDFGDFAGNVAGLGQDISSYIPSSLDTSVGQALSFGPFGDSGGGGGGGGFLSTLGDFARQAAPFLNIGTGLMGAAQGVMGARNLAQQSNIASGAAKQQSELSKQAAGVAAPLGQFSQEQLALASQGKIPPAVQATIENWRRAAKQQAADYAARSGQGSSSALASWNAWIDQQAQAMAASALESEQGLGIQAGGVAGNILGTAAGAAHGAGGTAAGNAGSLQDLIGAANQVLARLTAGAS